MEDRRVIVLCTPSSRTHRTAEENLGLGYTAAILQKAGYRVVIIDAWLNDFSINELVTKVLSNKDILFVGISCYYSSLDDVTLLVKNLRSDGFEGLVVAGGYGPSFHEQAFLNHGVNVVVRGESELMIAKLAQVIYKRELNDVSLAEVPGISWINKQKVIQKTDTAKVDDLDTLPFPIRDTINENSQLRNPVHISTSRGCTANCLFCSIVAFERLAKVNKIQWRQRSIRNIVEEMYVLYQEYGKYTFKIVDDSFIEPPRDAHWARQFLEVLCQYNLRIRFRTQIRAERINPELVFHLKLAGWFSTSVGIENFADTALQRMNKSANAHDNVQAIELLHKHGIYIVMNMILFDAATTIQELKVNLNYLQSLPPVITKGIFTEMYAAEGTAYTKLLEKKDIFVYDSHFMNRKYQIIDWRARLCYEGLKYWHRSHSHVYDHAINPIATPKDLDDGAYKQYYAEHRKLFALDVWFFTELLALVEKSEHITLDDVLMFVTEQIQATQVKVSAVEQAILDLDLIYGLVYVAEKNPFIQK